MVRIHAVLITAIIVSIAAALVSLHLKSRVKTITILYSGEERGYLEPCGCAKGMLGGIARRASLINELRRKSDDLLLLHNGDIIAQKGVQNEIKYEVTLMALKRMGYEIFNLGEGDLTLGVKRLKELQGAIGVNFLCLNASIDIPSEQDRKPFIGHLIKEYSLGRKAFKIGVIGGISDRYQLMLSNSDNRLRLTDLVDALRESIHEIRSKVDLIVVLAHADLDEAQRIAMEIPEINIIIAGHHRDEPLELPMRVGKCLIFNPGIKGKFLGKLDVNLDQNGKILNYHHEIIPVSEELREDEKIKHVVDLYRQMVIQADLLHRIKRIPTPSGSSYVGNESCQKCHKEEYSLWRETSHSRAYLTLIRRGYESDPECVICHTTGYGEISGFEDYQRTPSLANVGCEACHGPRRRHVENPSLEKYARVKEEKCRECHTLEKSPGFNYEVFWGRISHSK